MSRFDLDLLLPQPERRSDTWTYATVMSVAPLRIRLDGDSEPLPITPTTLCSPESGDRVRVHMWGSKIVVTGVVGGGGGAYWRDATSANLLSTVTQWDHRIQRAVRMEYDFMTDGMTGIEALTLGPQIGTGGSAIRPADSTVETDPQGDTHRYRLSLDFHIPAGVVTIYHAIRPTRNDSATVSGRIGWTQPVLSTPIVRSA